MAGNTTIPDVEAIADLLSSAGINQAEAIAALAQPSIRICTKRASPLPRGSSRFGGSPDVPRGFNWPTKNGRPLTFIAQINLTEVSSPDLPETGWLLFFYDVEELPFGFDPLDLGGAQVIHISVPASDLKKIEHPKINNYGGPFQSCSIKFKTVVEIPDLRDQLIEDLGIEVPQDHLDAYYGVADSISGFLDEPWYQHHLLGHPQLVQSDMRGECQLVTNGIYCGGPSELKDPRMENLLKSAAKEWRLLLQVNSDREADWMWGDLGTLYFWIRGADLAARRFDNVWFIVQAH